MSVSTEPIVYAPIFLSFIPGEDKKEKLVEK